MPIPPVVSWVLEHADAPEDFADFSQSMVLHAPAELTVSALREVIGAVVANHPMLTAALTEIDGRPHLEAGAARFDAQTAVTLAIMVPVFLAGSGS